MEVGNPFLGRRPVVVETKEDVDINRALWKVYIVIGITVISALGAGYLLSMGSYLYGTLATSVFFVLFTIQTFLIKDWGRIFGSIFTEASAFIGPFFAITSWDYLLGAWVSLAIFLLLGFRNSRSLLHGSLKIRFWETAKASLAQSTTGVLLALSLIYMSLFIGQGAFIDEKVFSDTLSSTDSMMGLFIPGFSFEGTVDENLHATIRANNPVGERILSFLNDTAELPVDLMTLPEDQKEKVIEQTVNELSKNISASLGEGFRADASVSDNMYRLWIVPFIERLTPEQRAYVGFSTILLIIITVKSVAIILYIPLIFAAFILYELFMASGFIVMRLEPCSREILLLK